MDELETHDWSDADWRLYHLCIEVLSADAGVDDDRRDVDERVPAGVTVH
jgi:hypothetical protein